LLDAGWAQQRASLKAQEQQLKSLLNKQPAAAAAAGAEGPPAAAAHPRKGRGKPKAEEAVITLSSDEEEAADSQQQQEEEEDEAGAEPSSLLEDEEEGSEEEEASEEEEGAEEEVEEGIEALGLTAGETGELCAGLEAGVRTGAGGCGLVTPPCHAHAGAHTPLAVLRLWLSDSYEACLGPVACAEPCCAWHECHPTCCHHPFY
jgi:hypothetical protein